MREQRNVGIPPTRRVDSSDLNVASPHRAGHSYGIHPEDRPCTTDERIPQQIPRQTVQYQYDDGEDHEVYETRIPTSARRYQVPATQGGTHTVVRYHRQPVPPRRSRTHEYPSPVQQRQTQERPTEPKRRVQPQWHWSVYVGLTMLVGLTVFVLGLVVLNWWHGLQDDLHYGRPRTSQYDVRVGHHDAHTPSHFIALNLNKHIEIIELPGGDATKAKLNQGPTLIGDGQELTPVTLEFRDVNGDGKPDMIVHIGDSRTVFINDNGQFRPARPSDPITL